MTAEDPATDGRATARPFAVSDRRRAPFIWMHPSAPARAIAAGGTNALAVYVILCKHADNFARGSWPSIDSIASQTSLSRRTVQRALRALCDHQLIDQQPRYRPDGGQATNGYAVIALVDNSPGNVDNPVDNSATPRVTPDTPPVSPVAHQELDSKELDPDVKTTVNDDFKKNEKTAKTDGQRASAPIAHPRPDTKPCRSCGAQIFWLRTTRHKPIPMNAHPTANGPIIIGPDQTAIYAKNVDISDARPRYSSHFETCPYASRHRRQS